MAGSPPQVLPGVTGPIGTATDAEILPPDPIKAMNLFWGALGQHLPKSINRATHFRRAMLRSLR